MNRTSENLQIKEYEPDPELTALLASYDTRAKEDAVTPIGELKGGDLAPENEIDCLPQAMVQDTALLDFINEVQMYYTGAQVSATALTSMTSQMRAGTIRKCDMASIYTYQNTLYKLQMTGEQLRRFMEWSAAFFKTWKPDEVTIAFDPSVRYYLYDAFEGVNYELDVSKEPGHRIKNLKWPNGKAVKDTDTFVVAVNNYRATTQLLTAADIFLPGEELPKLLEIDVRGDVGGIRELLGEYIRTVKGGTIEPHVNNNWKIVGNNWKAADHQKAVQLLREGKLALNENADARTLPGKAITTRISPSSKKQFPVKRGFPCWDGKPLFCVRNRRISTVSRELVEKTVPFRSISWYNETVLVSLLWADGSKRPDRARKGSQKKPCRKRPLQPLQQHRAQAALPSCGSPVRRAIP